ncbi:MAG TPA: MBL fold metallo-hydrolase [Rhodanobacteraceae bacterium]|nr:MBL fold metallo-hydrolase [Rhodanobacteraceae bacterium]
MTRRAFGWLAAWWVGMLVGPMAPARAATWAPSHIDMPVHQVGPHSYYVEGRLDEATRANQGFIANAGFVVTGDGVIVFDALGSPALADRLLAEIRKRTTQPVRLVVISHYHADHFYGIPALRAAGAKVWADVRAKAYLDSEAARQRLAERRALIGKYLGPDFKLPLPDRWIDHDQTFHMGEVTLSLYRFGPAHSPEDLGMLVEPDGVLFSGDVIYAGRAPFIGPDSDTRHWLAAISEVLALHPRVMVPGHGPASHDPRKDAQFTRGYIEFLRQRMGEAVRNWESFDEAYARTDWSRFKDVPTFHPANRLNAYSTYLQMEQEWLKQGGP